jgi:hypothetical protein
MLPRRESHRFLAHCILLALVACLSGCQSCKRHAPTGSIQGRVVDSSQSPVAGVQVRAPGKAPAITNAQGEFELSGLSPTPRLAVSFSAPGFVNTTQVYEVSAVRRGVNVVVIWPRSEAVPADAALGGKISFSQGGGLTLPPNALVDSNGTTMTGQVQVRLTYLDVSDPAQLDAAPGDFTAQMSDGALRKLESFGIFEIVVTDSAGRPVELARGQTAALELPIPRSFLGRAPETSGLFSFDPSRGLWVEEGRLSRNDLVYSGTIDRFDWSWNADIPEETTCMTFKVVRPWVNNQPEPNCLVEATGVGYGSKSKGHTDVNGLVCLLVKRNSQVKLQAFSTENPTYVSVPKTVTSPDIASGAQDCGDEERCPLTIIPLDIIVGDRQ